MSYVDGNDNRFMNHGESVLSWHQRPWKQLCQSLNQQRIPHALLLVGYPGIGKRLFADQWARLLLCEHRVKKTEEEMIAPCCQCRSCVLLEAGTHPDYLRLEPEEDSQTIKIDPVRECVEKTNKPAQIAHSQIIVVDPADQLNRNAANALLKTLEEPSPNTFFVLITHRMNRLPATIRSRCQIIHFDVPSLSAGKAWLEKQKLNKTYSEADLELLLRMADGAPFRALTFSEEDYLEWHREVLMDLVHYLQNNMTVIQLSAKWDTKNNTALILEWLMGFVQDLIRFKQTKSMGNSIPVDIQDAFMQVASLYTEQQLYRWYDALMEAHYLTVGPVHVNERLLLERLLLMVRLPSSRF